MVPTSLGNLLGQSRVPGLSRPATKLWDPMKVSIIRVDSSWRKFGSIGAVKKLAFSQPGERFDILTCAITWEILENLGYGKLSEITSGLMSEVFLGDYLATMFEGTFHTNHSFSSKLWNFPHNTASLTPPCP